MESLNAAHQLGAGPCAVAAFRVRVVDEEHSNREGQIINLLGRCRAPSVT